MGKLTVLEDALARIEKHCPTLERYKSSHTDAYKAIADRLDEYAAIISSLYKKE